MNHANARVLIVDDEVAIRRLLRNCLGAHGYTIHEAGSGEDALGLYPTVHPDLLLIDLGLPGLDGAALTRCLREWSQTPIIMLSISDDECDKIAALDAGADDYVTKPFAIGELLARIRASLRRASSLGIPAVFLSGDLRVDLARREVHLADATISLTPTEFELLKMLAKHAGKVLTHRQLMREVWGASAYGEDLHLLRVNISNLRHKLEPDPSQPRYVLTEPGVGYRLAAG